MPKTAKLGKVERQAIRSAIEVRDTTAAKYRNVYAADRIDSAIRQLKAGNMTLAAFQTDVNRAVASCEDKYLSYDADAVNIAPASSTTAYSSKVTPTSHNDRTNKDVKPAAPETYGRKELKRRRRITKEQSKDTAAIEFRARKAAELRRLNAAEETPAERPSFKSMLAATKLPV